MARSQAGEEPALTALGCWQHDPVHSHSNAPAREVCKVSQPSITSILKDTTHRGSSSNLPDPVHSHLLLLQVLHHWQHNKVCFSSRTFHYQLHLCVPLAKPPLSISWQFSPLSHTCAPCKYGSSFPPGALSCPSPHHREICPFGTILSQLSRQELAFQLTYALHFEFKVSSP